MSKSRYFKFSLFEVAFIFCLYILAKTQIVLDLDYQSTEFSQQAASWTASSSQMQNCSGEFILQGPGSGKILTKSFNLSSSPASITFSFDLYILNSFTQSENLTLFISGASMSSQFDIQGPMEASAGACLTQVPKVHIKGEMRSFSSNMLNVTFQTSSSVGDYSYGIRNFWVAPGNPLQEYICGNIISGMNKFTTNCICPFPNETNTSPCDTCDTSCYSCLSLSGCSSCAPGYYSASQMYFGKCEACSAATPCASCDVSSPGICTSCPSSSYLYSDGTCQASCPFVVSQGRKGGLNCSSPCADQLSYKIDGTCTLSCPSPLISSTYNNIAYCQSPCNSTKPHYSFFFSDCYASCTSPYQAKFDSSVPISKCIMIAKLVSFTQNATRPEEFLLEFDSVVDLDAVNLLPMLNFTLEMASYVYYNFTISLAPQYTTTYSLIVSHSSSISLAKASIQTISQFFIGNTDENYFEAAYFELIPPTLKDLIIVKPSTPIVLNDTGPANKTADQVAVEATTTVMQVTAHMGVAASIVGSISAGNSMLLGRQLTLLQSLLIIYLLNVNYPAHTTDFLAIFKIGKLDYIKNPLKSIVSNAESYSLYPGKKFYLAGFDGCILFGIGNIMMVIFCLFLTGFCFYLASKTFTGKLSEYSKKISTKLTVDGACSLLISFVSVTMISIGLQLTNIRFDQAVWALSSVLSILHLMAYFGFYYYIYTIHKTGKELKTFEKAPYIKKYNILFEPYRIGESEFPVPFILVTIIKDSSQGLLLALLYSVPPLLTIFEAFIEMVYMLSLIYYNPYKKRVDYYCNLIIEIWLLCCYGIVLSIMQQSNSIESKNSLGWALIVMVCIILVCYFAFVLITASFKIASMLRKDPPPGSQLTTADTNLTINTSHVSIKPLVGILNRGPIAIYKRAQKKRFSMKEKSETSTS